MTWYKWLGLAALLVATALVLALSVANWRAEEPPRLTKHVDTALRELRINEWTRPLLDDDVEPRSGNAYTHLRRAADARNADSATHFRLGGPVVSQLENGEFTDESRRRLASSSIRERLDAVDRARRQRFSWGFDRDSSVLPTLPNVGERDADWSRMDEFVARTVVIMLARGRMEGTDPCVRNAARVVRLIQDASAGVSPDAAEPRFALTHHLRHSLPWCAAGASAESLEEAREDFRRLLANPVPFGRSLQGELVATLDQSLDNVRRAGTIPTDRREIGTLLMAPGIVEWARWTFRQQQNLPELDPQNYPASAERVEELKAKFDDIPAELRRPAMIVGAVPFVWGDALRNAVERHQAARNAIRAAYSTLVYYETYRTTDNSRPPELPPKPLDDRTAGEDTFTGEPFSWSYPEDRDTAALCYRKSRTDDGSDPDRTCWTLPPPR